MRAHVEKLYAESGGAADKPYHEKLKAVKK
jgi:hypothetical protein